VAGCYSVLEAFRAADTPSDHTRVAIFFDHEEIGSSTHIGAGGAFVENVLRRYIAAVDGASEAWERSTARSVLISNDASHALHPNYSDKHDTGYAPKIGGGPVLKLSSTWRYIDEPSVAGWFIAACRDAEVPVQQFRIRSDMRAGSTIGPHVASNLALRGLDVGVPMLAMHSARETASIDDVDRLLRVLQLILERTHDEILDPNPPR
jgi:aspartyl aminopeptidase